MQAASVDIGSNFRSQLAKLQINLSNEDWSSIARFPKKQNLIDDFEKDALMAKERAEQASKTPKP